MTFLPIRLTNCYIFTYRELADFKPSYYSLEFDASPRRSFKQKSKDKYVWNNKVQLGAHSQSKDTLIQECRRLEASLRAMSAGSLDVMEKVAQDSSITNKDPIKDRFSLDNLTANGTTTTKTTSKLKNDIKEAKSEVNHISEPSCHEDSSSNHGDFVGCQGNEIDGDSNLISAHSESALSVNLDWNLGGLDYEDFEGEILGNEVIVDSGFSEKLCDEFEPGTANTSIFNKIIPTIDIKIEGEDGVVQTKAQTTSSRKTPKINPFLKENSFDHYTFNSIHNISDDSESIEVIYEHNEEFEGPDGVFVDYKQPGKPPVEEQSFFGSVKSKLANLMDSKKEKAAAQSGMRKNQSYNNLNMKKQISKASGKLLDIGRALSKPEFTTEQAELADKLNFQVREFPLSSCPNVVGSEEKSSNHSKTKSKGKVKKEKSNSSVNQSQSINHHGNGDTVGQRVTNKTDFLQCDKSKQFSANDCRNSADSGICEVIYDGYIRIDSDKLPDVNGRDNTKQSALKNQHSEDGECNGTSSCSGLNTNINNIPKESLKYSKNCDTSQQASYPNPTQCNMNNENPSHSGNSSPSLRVRRQRKNLIGSQPTSAKSIDEHDLSNEDIVFDSPQTTSENWTTDGKVPSRLSRYYHVFKEGELERLISCYVPELKVIQCFYDHANWCVIAEKL